MMTHPSTWTTWQLFGFFGPKIFFAILCGGIIGLERELKNKAAGIKTNILICVGSALYTSVSVLISTSLTEQGHLGDPARVAAQIVSGIGFLGGGTIIQSRGTILGLTTAATIWVVAAIGIAVGLGYSDVGVVVSMSVVLILVGTNLFEDKVLGRSLSFLVEIGVEDPNGDVRHAINQRLASADLVIEDFQITSRSGMTVLRVRYNGHRVDHKKFILELWGVPGIREVQQL